MTTARPELLNGIPVLRDAGTATLRPTGELDLDSSARLAACFDDLLADQVCEVVVDLSEVSFLDTTGLRSMLRTAVQLADQGGRLRLLHPQAAVERVLRVTQSEHLLEA